MRNVTLLATVFREVKKLAFRWLEFAFYPL